MSSNSSKPEQTKPKTTEDEVEAEVGEEARTEKAEAEEAVEKERKAPKKTTDDSGIQSASDYELNDKLREMSLKSDAGIVPVQTVVKSEKVQWKDEFAIEIKQKKFKKREGSIELHSWECFSFHPDTKTDDLCTELVNSINEYLVTSEYEDFVQNLTLDSYICSYDELSATSLKSPLNLLNHFPDYFRERSFVSDRDSIEGVIIDELIKKVVKRKSTISNTFSFSCAKDNDEDITVPEDNTFHVNGKADVMYNNCPIELKTKKTFNKKINLNHDLKQIAVYQMLSKKVNEKVIDFKASAYLLLISRDNLEVALAEVPVDNIEIFVKYWAAEFKKIPKDYGHFFDAYREFIDLKKNKNSTEEDKKKNRALILYHTCVILMKMIQSSKDAAEYIDALKGAVGILKNLQDKLQYPQQNPLSKISSLADEITIWEEAIGQKN